MQEVYFTPVNEKQIYTIQCCGEWEENWRNYQIPKIKTNKEGKTTTTWGCVNRVVPPTTYCSNIPNNLCSACLYQRAVFSHKAQMAKIEKKYRVELNEKQRRYKRKLQDYKQESESFIIRLFSQVCEKNHHLAKAIEKRPQFFQTKYFRPIEGGGKKIK